ncbi:hypothetical protein ACRAWF_03960 [Streptomyces sp. L7]
MTEDEEEVALAGALAGLRERYPDVTVRCRRPRGRSRRALVEASADSQLLVVGARGRFGFVGLPLDPVCHDGAARGGLPRRPRPLLTP